MLTKSLDPKFSLSYKLSFTNSSDLHAPEIKIIYRPNNETDMLFDKKNPFVSDP